MVQNPLTISVILTNKRHKEEVNTTTSNSGSNNSTGWAKNGIILYTLILSNTNRFSKCFHCKNQEIICDNTMAKNPTTPQMQCYVTTLCLTKAPQHDISLIAPLVSDTAKLNASYSSKTAILNI